MFPMTTINDLFLNSRTDPSAMTAISFESSSDVAAHFRPRFTGKREEVVIAVFLNGQNQSLGEKEITEGTPTQATVYVRRILEEALHVSAAAIVMVHNHPSGNSEPSAGDDDTTCRLLAACNLVEIVLLDHIIVGESDHYSYSGSGRLKQLERE